MITPCINGSIRTLDDIVRRLNPRSLLVFAGGASYRDSGASTVVTEVTAGRSAITISNVRANPEIGDVDAAIALYRDLQPELVIATGGGSVIDLAKAVRSVAPHSSSSRPYVIGERPIERPGAPLLAIPTTAGTGSEATHFAVVYVDGNKHSIAHRSMRPEYVILDPELTYSMSPSVTAATGLDALCQSIESFWSVQSTRRSRDLAERAIMIALDNLETAVNNPDPASRCAMCTAAHLAGRAIDESFTTAPHALSYVLTSRYGIAHGHAVALTLGAVLEYNADVDDETCADPRGATYVVDTVQTVVSMLGASDAGEARRFFEDLVGRLGLGNNFDSVGLSPIEARRHVLEGVNLQRLTNNPRTFTDQSLAEMLTTIG